MEAPAARSEPGLSGERLPRAEGPGGPGVVLRLHPEDHAVASLARRHGVGGHDEHAHRSQAYRDLVRNAIVWSAGK